MEKRVRATCEIPHRPDIWKCIKVTKAIGVREDGRQYHSLISSHALVRPRPSKPVPHRGMRSMRQLPLARFASCRWIFTTLMHGLARCPTFFTVLKASVISRTQSLCIKMVNLALYRNNEREAIIGSIVSDLHVYRYFSNAWSGIAQTWQVR